MGRTSSERTVVKIEIESVGEVTEGHRVGQERAHWQVAGLLTGRYRDALDLRGGLACRGPLPPLRAARPWVGKGLFEAQSLSLENRDNSFSLQVMRLICHSEYKSLSMEPGI